MKPFPIAVFALAVAACSNEKPPNDPSTASQSTATAQTTVADSSYQSGPTEDAPRDAAARNDSWSAAPRDATPATAAAGATEPKSKAVADVPVTPAPQAARTTSQEGARTTPPDNTRVNERDRNEAALTPLDQSNSQADTKITQLVRKAVVGDKSLSFTAKNVKIITQGGKVTLRGPVNTAAERASIEQAAKAVAGVTAVDNQLEVKP